MWHYHLVFQNSFVCLILTLTFFYISCTSLWSILTIKGRYFLMQINFNWKSDLVINTTFNFFFKAEHKSLHNKGATYLNIGLLRWISSEGSTYQCRRCRKHVCTPSLGGQATLEMEMATHSYILAWKIPWTEEPRGLQSMGSQRVGHDGETEHPLTQI